MTGIILLGLFLCSGVFPEALLRTVRLVRRLKYQFTRFRFDTAESRTPDLPAPKRAHLNVQNELPAMATVFRVIVKEVQNAQKD